MLSCSKRGGTTSSIDLSIRHLLGKFRKLIFSRLMPLNIPGKRRTSLLLVHQDFLLILETEYC